VLPRSKATTDTETHLTIATSVIDGGRDPVMYAGNLAVLGIEGRNVVNIGCVGQRMIEYQWGLAGWSEVPPTATLTAGYTVRSQFSNQPIRFGDPHAIYNPHPRDVQVCGFIATQNGGTQADIESRRDLFTMLGALPFGPDNA
jgi:hypothetical protein